MIDIKEIFNNVLKEFKEHPGIPGEPYHPLSIGDHVKIHWPDNYHHGETGYIHDLVHIDSQTGKDLGIDEPHVLMSKEKAPSYHPKNGKLIMPSDSMVIPISNIIKQSSGHLPDLDDKYQEAKNKKVIDTVTKGMKKV